MAKELKLNKTETKFVDSLQIGSAPQIVFNPFSGESAELVPIAVAVYSAIKSAERVADYKTMNKGLTMFRKYWGDEYMTLLD